MRGDDRGCDEPLPLRADLRHLEGEFGRLMEGGEGNITVPIPVFLIEHPKGRALFDTGLHPDCQNDAAGGLASE